MIILLTLLIFITLFIFTFLLLNVFYKGRIKVAMRLERIKGQDDMKEDIDELDDPFYQRIVKPLTSNIYEITSRITPMGTKKRIEEKLIRAGNPYGLGVNQWFLIKLILGIILPVVFFIYCIINELLFSTVPLIFIGVVIFANILPTLFLIQVTTKRQSDIVKTLPDVLDLLTVSVQAGLSFDGALSRLVEKMPGALSKEFNRVLHSMRMGKGRGEALKEMSNRCGVPDLTTPIGSLIQAEQLGVGIGSVLRIQSEQIRQKRRQRAQEKAMKAPIKILFPLVIFIFPSIFAVLLGPALINIIENL